MSGAKTSRPTLNRRLDPSQFQAQLAQANATGMSAQASQQALRANANIDHGDAAMKDAPTTAGLARKLMEAGAAPAMNLRNAEAALAETNAQVASYRPTERGQSAGAGQPLPGEPGAGRTGEGRGRRGEVNLNHTVIEAPINCVLVARKVDVGQT
jgi:multidrug resistance efflux pump